ncbi:hypothetical protein [Neisseria perflava]|jgi:hypothetical protein|uniref:hypothetical protein n=1 Tax=Neisseria perflava TaxID=33053 RepID=UPI00352C38F2
MKETISNLKKGGLDVSGNKIINILAKYNEFIIYEIDIGNIQDRIKVFIDGHTDNSERIIQDKFSAVKLNYIKAKSTLLHSANFETNKQRVAHALANCLSGNNSNDENNQLFIELITTIKKEQNEILKNRILYFLPSLLLVMLCFCLCLYIYYKNIIEGARLENYEFWVMLLSSLLSISLGGCLSIMSGAKLLNFQQFVGWYYYVFLGLERLLFSMFTGAIAFVVIKSNLVSSIILSKGNWSLMMILIIAGFSERLIPSILTKSENTIFSKQA